MQHLVASSVLVGAAAVDAIGAAQDRREELNRAKNQCGKNAATIFNDNLGGKANYYQNNVPTITKHQASMLLGLGGQIVFLMKLLMGSVIVLSVLCVLLILKK